MKKLFRVLIPMLVLSTLLVSACTGVSTPLSASGGGKVEAAPVEFTGVIEFINGNQWVVNGQTITVDPAIVNDGPFNVGDTVKVEADVQADGSILVTRVEAPSAVDNSNDANGNDVNSNDANSNDSNSNDVNSNEDNGNDDNSNDDNGNDDNSNDDNGNDDNSNDDNGNDDNSNDDNGDDSSDDDGYDDGDNGNADDSSSDSSEDNSNSGGSND